MNVTYEIKVYGKNNEPKFDLPKVVEAKVTKTLNEPTRLDLVLPIYSNLYENYLKVGDKIVWKRGYDGENQTLFIGYIRDINDVQPFNIVAYDKLYSIRRQWRKKSPSNPNSPLKVDEYLKYILSPLVDGGIKIRGIDLPQLNKYVKNTWDYLTLGALLREYVENLIGINTLSKIEYSENDQEIYVLESDKLGLKDAYSTMTVVTNEGKIIPYQIYENDVVTYLNTFIDIYDNQIILGTSDLKYNEQKIVQVICHLQHEVMEFDLKTGEYKIQTTVSYPSEVGNYGVTYDEYGNPIPNYGTNSYLEEDEITFELIEKYYKDSQYDRIDLLPLAKEIYIQETANNGKVGGKFLMLGSSEQYGIPKIEPNRQINVHMTRQGKFYGGLHVGKVIDTVKNGIKQEVYIRTNDE
jgi:hypothetical protein